MATNLNRRLEKPEEAVKDKFDPDDIDITEAYYSLMDELFGSDPRPGPRPRIRVSREFLELADKIYGHDNELKEDQDIER
jgi:hypothetical protein